MIPLLILGLVACTFTSLILLARVMRDCWKAWDRLTDIESQHRIVTDPTSSENDRLCATARIAAILKEPR